MRSVEKQVFSTADKLLFHEGVDAVKRLEADIQDISKNDSICLYKEKGKKTKRPRFDGEESWRVIWSLFEYQHYDDSQYKTPQTQLELIFRKGSCLALELALIILRQGDLNVPFSGGHASRTTHEYPHNEPLPPPKPSDFDYTGKDFDTEGDAKPRTDSNQNAAPYISVDNPPACSFGAGTHCEDPALRHSGLTGGSTEVVGTEVPSEQELMDIDASPNSSLDSLGISDDGEAEYNFQQQNIISEEKRDSSLFQQKSMSIDSEPELPLVKELLEAIGNPEFQDAIQHLAKSLHPPGLSSTMGETTVLDRTLGRAAPMISFDIRIIFDHKLSDDEKKFR